MAIYQLPGSNALKVAKLVKAKMRELKKSFPDDLNYSIVYDTTPFITESVREVFQTLRDAVSLVAVVVLSLFATAGWALRSRRAGSMAVNFVSPAVLEAAGIRNILSKSMGSKNHIAVVHATLNGLLKLRLAADVHALRSHS